jgi:hypothetical protein
LQEYVTDTLQAIATVGTDRVPVLLDVDRKDYAELRGFVGELLADEPDADLEQELRLHLETAAHATCERARHRGFL